MSRNKKMKEIVISRLATYNQQSKLNADRTDRQERLRKLVKDYDLELVALAGGFTENTLLQYVRVTVAPAISEDKVVKAETILKGL